jgi:Pyruvate/2-oxoacid:ferredoxin oxidoreductase delta subunit
MLRQVGNMMYGMQGMSSDVRRCAFSAGYASCIAGQLQGTAEGSEVGNMLYGMQGMSSDVRRCVQCWVCFLHCWAGSRWMLKRWAICCGMQGSSDVPEVRSVLGMLPALLGSCKEPLKAQAGEAMMYGMQGMSSDVPGCVQCWVCFLHCWAAARAESQAVGNMPYGMQGMSDVPEVRSVLGMLPDCLGSCREPLEAQAVGNMLYGMQGMSSDVPGRSVLGMLPALLGSYRAAEGSEGGNALYGLSSMNNLEKFIPFLEVWLRSGQRH